ncbi:hypothetical protein C0Q70_07841 [Pomacea canaliculata]|uniref:Uncharacterized protein n=1 Tax=Pomacea canaliculata TaxID=400727 RepID=A0A2T7PG47_POMCA|nr:hypothetical protein C0Q70_07841 [Pomacea canaliculata]
MAREQPLLANMAFGSATRHGACSRVQLLPTPVCRERVLLTQHSRLSSPRPSVRRKTVVASRVDRSDRYRLNGWSPRQLEGHASYKRHNDDLQPRESVAQAAALSVPIIQRCRVVAFAFSGVTPANAF